MNSSETKSLVNYSGGISIIEKSKTPARLINKNGKCNIFQPLSKRQRFVFLQFTRLVDSSWSWTIVVFLATLLLSWYGFAVIWWLICYTHGDFEPNHLPPFQKENNFRPCVYHMYNFASCFMFSIETQHTVGYGVKAPTEECPEAIFVNAMQCIIGFIMQGFMAVIILAKMTLPRLRSQTLLFSKNAVICTRNGESCLMFRIGDMRKNHIIDANVKAYFVSTKRTIEGELLKHCQTELSLMADNCKGGLFFNWPLIITHKINRESPLYYLTEQNVLHEKFEIVVVLEGTIESTGQMTQAKTSYMNSEIVWGKKFESLLNFNYDRNEYEADFSKFDNLLPISRSDTHLPSIKENITDEYSVQDRNVFNFFNNSTNNTVNKENIEEHRERIIKISSSSDNDESEEECADEDVSNNN